MRYISSKNSCHKQDQKRRIGSRFIYPLRAIGRYVGRLANRFFDQRHGLDRLNDHQLRDIGLTRDQLHSNKQRCLSELAKSAHPDVGYLQGELQHQYRKRVRRLPED